MCCPLLEYYVSTSEFQLVFWPLRLLQQVSLSFFVFGLFDCLIENYPATLQLPSALPTVFLSFLQRAVCLKVCDCFDSSSMSSHVCDVSIVLRWDNSVVRALLGTKWQTDKVSNQLVNVQWLKRSFSSQEGGERKWLKRKWIVDVYKCFFSSSLKLGFCFVVVDIISIT